MNKLYILLLLVICTSCSKEKVKEQQTNLIVQAMVNGEWKVTSFMVGSADATADFNPYRFRFKENLTVDAVNNGSLEKSGTWSADAVAKTITSSFSGVTDPLALLNGTWQIQNTTWTSVLATQTVNGELRTLRLEK